MAAAQQRDDQNNQYRNRSQINHDISKHPQPKGVSRKATLVARSSRLLLAAEAAKWPACRPVVKSSGWGRLLLLQLLFAGPVLLPSVGLAVFLGLPCCCCC